MSTTTNKSLNAAKKLIEIASTLNINAQIIESSKPRTRRYSALGSTFAPQKVIILDGIRMSLGQAKQYISARQ